MMLHGWLFNALTAFSIPFKDAILKSVGIKTFFIVFKF